MVSYRRVIRLEGGSRDRLVCSMLLCSILFVYWCKVEGHVCVCVCERSGVLGVGGVDARERWIPSHLYPQLSIKLTPYITQSARREAVLPPSLCELRGLEAPDPSSGKTWANAAGRNTRERPGWPCSSMTKERSCPTFARRRGWADAHYPTSGCRVEERR